MKKITISFVFCIFSLFFISEAGALSMLRSSGKRSSQSKYSNANDESYDFAASYRYYSFDDGDDNEPSKFVSPFDGLSGNESFNDSSQNQDQSNQSDDQQDSEHTMDQDTGRGLADLSSSSDDFKDTASEPDQATAAAPEPASMLLLGFGLAGLAARGFGKRVH